MQKQFTDGRGRKIAFVAHCILNANARHEDSDTSTIYPAGVGPVINLLQEHKVGVVQLPCPEQIFSHYRPATAKEDMDTPEFRAHCAKISREAAQSIKKYSELGVKTVCIIGSRKSPSCGVNYSALKGGAFGNTCRGGVVHGHRDATAMPERLDADVKATYKRGGIKVPGEKGIFVEELEKALKAEGIQVPMMDFCRKDEAECVEELRGILEK